MDVVDYSILCLTTQLLLPLHTHTVVEVEFVEPMYTVPENGGPATVCLQSNIGTKTELSVTVTVSEKSPVEAQGSW